jgi:hypothetical protein
MSALVSLEREEKAEASAAGVRKMVGMANTSATGLQSAYTKLYDLCSRRQSAKQPEPFPRPYWCSLW